MFDFKNLTDEELKFEKEKVDKEIGELLFEMIYSEKLVTLQNKLECILKEERSRDKKNV